jgi:hypothetical protein
MAPVVTDYAALLERDSVQVTKGLALGVERIGL